MRISMNKTKVVGVGIISIVIICFIVMLGLVIVELYLKPNKKTDIKLYETEYYGKHLDNTPYKDFTVQYIHPYYMFSLPWQMNDRVNTKNNIVSIDDNGFRKVKPAITTSHELQKVILLGGSTAFGHFASSDRGTIGSFLGELGSLDVINRSAPSWNSHQEAVALFKFDQLEKINASISFSLANDISIICLERDFNNNDEIL